VFVEYQSAGNVMLTGSITGFGIQDHRRRHRDVTVDPIGVLDLAVDEVEVDVLGDLSQNMIAANALIQTDTVVKQLRLEIWLAARHGGVPSLFCYLLSNKQIKECLSRLIWATARQDVTPYTPLME
jgi:hypothetical protein